MTAQRIGIYTIDFPDPTVAVDDDDQNTQSGSQVYTLASSIAFRYRVPSNIQTLSTKGAGGSGEINGILYVPDLQSDACKELEKDHVPANATRLANLPSDKNHALMAFAPWFDPKCMTEYFAAARRVTTSAFLVYQPGESNAQPPVLNDISWNLNDGGSWQTANHFPTYALSSMTGNVVMEQLNLYSRNLTDVPNGDELNIYFKDTDYIRLWATIGTDLGGAQLPSLWVFLVIVLAILIIAVGVTSFCMHVIQRRRRNALRQRVLDGEVDLEALGVKRLTVPQKTLDKFPIYTYTEGTNPFLDKAPQPPAPALLGASGSSVDAETGTKQPPATHNSTAHSTPSTRASTALSQPTCAICLDDYEHNETQVRELPCRHIFHPDCIDTFLLSNSSLCPMCKQSVLPGGVCPVPITNTMVRRERYISSMRARREQALNPSPNRVQSIEQPGTVSSRIRGALPGRRIFSAPARTSTTLPEIEMASAHPSHASRAVSAQTQPPEISPVPAPVPPTLPDCAPTHNRREWARQRAMAMLGNTSAHSGVEDEEQTTPKWKRMVNKVFPGFR